MMDPRKNPVLKAAGMRALTKIYGRPRGMTGTDIWNAAMSPTTVEDFGRALAQKRAFDQEGLRRKQQERRAIDELSMAAAKKHGRAADRAAQERMHRSGLRSREGIADREMDMRQSIADQNRQAQQSRYAQQQARQQAVEDRYRAQNQRLRDQERAKMRRFRQQQELYQQKLQQAQLEAQARAEEKQRKLRFRQLETQYKQLTSRLKTLQKKRPYQLSEQERRALEVIPQKLSELESEMSGMGAGTAPPPGASQPPAPDASYSERGIVEEAEFKAVKALNNPDNKWGQAARQRFPNDPDAQKQWLIEEYTRLKANG